MLHVKVFRYILVYTMLITRICNALNKEKILYAVVGGYAVSLHGAVRGTVDIDFIVKWDVKVLKQVEDALKELGLVSRLPITSEDVFNYRDEYINKKNLIAWNFYNLKNISEQVDIIITEDASKYTITTKKTEFGDIKVLSISDLIKMKLKAGRPQDKEDVKALEKLK
jgi:hypothetical protein